MLAVRRASKRRYLRKIKQNLARLTDAPFGLLCNEATWMRHCGLSLLLGLEGSIHSRTCREEHAISCHNQACLSPATNLPGRWAAWLLCLRVWALWGRQQMAGCPQLCQTVTDSSAHPGCLLGSQLTQRHLAGAFLQDPGCRLPYLLLFIQALSLKLTYLPNSGSGLPYVSRGCIDFVESGGADRNNISEEGYELGAGRDRQEVGGGILPLGSVLRVKRAFLIMFKVENSQSLHTYSKKLKSQGLNRYLHTYVHSTITPHHVQ